jgi:hypothetical protein
MDSNAVLVRAYRRRWKSKVRNLGAPPRGQRMVMSVVFLEHGVLGSTRS